MKSKASIKSHPIHPMIVAFPIAFFTGALVSDAVAYFIDIDFLWRMGQYLALGGIIMALAAAIPGIIDYVNTVPPKSSGKARATKHAVLNVTNVLLFAGAFFYRITYDYNAEIVLALEAIGFVLMSIAGWLGGTLVYRNQIGIDPRYANAGKWKELHIAEAGGQIEVATADELEINQMKLIYTKNKRIVLGRTEQGYTAFDDHCTHRGGSLAGGMMICGTVQCPWHGSQFDVCTGEVKAGPAKKNINIYEVKQTDDKVYLVL